MYLIVYSLVWRLRVGCSSFDARPRQTRKHQFFYGLFVIFETARKSIGHGNIKVGSWVGRVLRACRRSYVSRFESRTNCTGPLRRRAVVKYRILYIFKDSSCTDICTLAHSLYFFPSTSITASFNFAPRSTRRAHHRHSPNLFRALPHTPDTLTTPLNYLFLFGKHLVHKNRLSILLYIGEQCFVTRGVIYIIVNIILY